MSDCQQWKHYLTNHQDVIIQLNGPNSATAGVKRWCELLDAYNAAYHGGNLRCFSVPGRAEIGGNHTDHNHGRVLAASVTLDTIAVVEKWDKPIIEILSLGFGLPYIIDLANLSVREADKNTTTALIRGVAERMHALGCGIGGFRAVITSDVMPGSGLSSSAAFEVMIVTILDGLYNNNALSGMEKAIIGRYAENVHFGKPCGLMDQTACALGGMIAIDFKNPAAPSVLSIPFDFNAQDLYLAVVNTGGGHEDLTGEYAAIFREMKYVAGYFGKQVLREVGVEDFYQALPALRKQYGDRAVLRAAHFFGENERVACQTKALLDNDINRFLEGVIQSGRSSYMWLQNCYVSGNNQEQGISVALMESERLLSGKGGAWRVQGGGFAGTIQAFVPGDLREVYKGRMDEVFGADACRMIAIRLLGAVEIGME